MAISWVRLNPIVRKGFLRTRNSSQVWMFETFNFCKFQMCAAHQWPRPLSQFSFTTAHSQPEYPQWTQPTLGNFPMYPPASLMGNAFSSTSPQPGAGGLPAGHPLQVHVNCSCVALVTTCTCLLVYSVHFLNHVTGTSRTPPTSL